MLSPPYETIDPDARARYGQARDEQWAFLRDNYFDTQYGGIWQLPVKTAARVQKLLPRWLRQRSPAPAQRKTHGWKDPLHEVLTFLALGQQ